MIEGRSQLSFWNIYSISIIFIGQSTSSVIYGHDGRRAASNWKGSASYFHIRDAVPVYYWPDNHGAYTIYATVKHFIERNFFSTKYFKDIATGRYYSVPIFIIILTVFATYHLIALFLNHLISLIFQIPIGTS